MNKNTNSKKIRKALVLFIVPVLLAPALNGCFIDDMNKMMDAFKPYMQTLTEKASNPQNAQLFQAAADQGEKKFQEDTKAKLAGEQAAPAAATKKEGTL